MTAYRVTCPDGAVRTVSAEGVLCAVRVVRVVRYLRSDDEDCLYSLPPYTYREGDGIASVRISDTEETYTVETLP